MSQNSTLRIRFRFNQQTGKRSDVKQVMRKASQSFAQSIIEDVGLEYADAEYERLKSQIEYTLRNDVLQEIEHVARQFKQFIVGSSANSRSMRAELSTAAQTSTGYALDGTPLSNSKLVGGRAWTPRKKRYLRDKARTVGHQRWFEHRGLLGSAINKGSFWTNAFGPIQVKVVRRASEESITGRLNAGGAQQTSQTAKIFGRASVGRFAVARIEASAFGRITPAMLPALISGNTDASVPADGRASGLMNLVGNADLRVAHRLGGGPHVPYRHTLEPFLAFAITRAIPTAVFNRIQKGLNTQIDGRGYRVR